MFHKYIKLVIAAGILVWSGFQFVDGNIMNGISLVLLAGIFVLFYFKNEFILLAFWQLRKQNFAGASKWLSYIKNPGNALVKKQEGYYNFLQGIMVPQNNLTQAEKFFKKAISLGLNMKHDLAMAKLQLAGIAMSKRRKREATTLLNEAKKLDTQNVLAEQVKMLKQQLKKI
jgi:tetratricopeptide (TPR) repeat protein